MIGYGIIMTEPSLTMREAVIEAVNRMFILTDNRDWGALKDCFMENVLFNTALTDGVPKTITREEIIEGWTEGLKNLTAIHHQTGNYLVTIGDDGADLFCYGIAYHYLPNRTNKNVKFFVGSYSIHLVSEENRWKIDKFAFTLKFVAGNVNLRE
jgi:hypothetical protein